MDSSSASTGGQAPKRAMSESSAFAEGKPDRLP